MEKKQTWTKFRHKVITHLIKPFFRPYVLLRYHIKVEKFADQGSRPYLIIMNHQTAYDQFFVAMVFNRPVYYVASEDIFSMGWVSRLIRWLVAPIPIKKQTTDLQAVKTCIRVAREGGTICLAPEGNRTYHGKNVYMKPGIASMAKKLSLPLAFLRIEGGYGIQPRWSDVIRKGSMRCYVSRVVEPEQLMEMSNTELMALIEQELNVDEAKVTGTFPHPKNAEFLERVVYTCPRCGLAPWESSGELIQCTKCGLTVRHKATKELEGVEEDFPHRFVADWYEAQNDYVNQLDLTGMVDVPVFVDTAQFSRVHVNSHKEALADNTKVCLYGDRITVDDRVFPFDGCSAVTVLGKNKLNIYFGSEVFQLKGSKRFNALKYVNFYHRYKNIIGGQDDKFLGL